MVQNSNKLVLLRQKTINYQALVAHCFIFPREIIEQQNSRRYVSCVCCLRRVESEKKLLPPTRSKVAISRAKKRSKMATLIN